MFNILETELVSSKLKLLATTGKAQEDFLYSNITEYDNSIERTFILKAQEYYKNNNNIKERKRLFINRKGTLEEVTNLSNTKLAHPLLRKLVNQKVNYLLSQEPTIKTIDENETTVKILEEYFNKDFFKAFKNIGKHAIINGIAWLQIYYNEIGELKYKRIPTEEIIPFWQDADHTILDGVIRYYTIIKYLPNGTKKEIKKVEYHTVEGSWYYEQTNNGLKQDPDKSNGFQGHFKLKKGETEEQLVWQKVPFIAFKYNQDELPLLQLTESLIDNYDLITSDLANNLLDIPNSIKVVKNYDGTDKGEFTHNLSVFRTAFVSQDGDMSTLETPLDINSIDSHLNRLRKDIYDAGSGIDTQEIATKEASGVALQFRYADLDVDTKDMANEFKVAIQELLWFVNIDMINKGKGELKIDEIEIVFNKATITNEAETIASCVTSSGLISKETILANHPWVEDIEKELESLKKEQESAMQELEQTVNIEAEAYAKGSNTGGE
jgi:SPP1 family phage portal protein